jgi:hypothetical protein
MSHLAIIMWTPWQFAQAVFMAVVAVGLASRVEDIAERGVRWLIKRRMK